MYVNKENNTQLNNVNVNSKKAMIKQVLVKKQSFKENALANNKKKSNTNESKENPIKFQSKLNKTTASQSEYNISHTPVNKNSATLKDITKSNLNNATRTPFQQKNLNSLKSTSKVPLTNKSIDHKLKSEDIEIEHIPTKNTNYTPTVETMYPVNLKYNPKLNFIPFYDKKLTDYCKSIGNKPDDPLLGFEEYSNIENENDIFDVLSDLKPLIYTEIVLDSPIF